MAIPDYRACFDHYRYPTRLSDWLRSYHHPLIQPDAESLFDSDSNTAFLLKAMVNQALARHSSTTVIVLKF
jgi:hypothetical protein